MNIFEFRCFLTERKVEMTENRTNIDKSRFIYPSWVKILDKTN